VLLLLLLLRTSKLSMSSLPLGYSVRMRFAGNHSASL
jgi:hypothetical protein